MSRKIKNTAVGFVGAASIMAGVALSPPILRTLTGIELSSRSATLIAWAMASLMVVIGAMLVFKREHISYRNIVVGLAYIVFILALVEGILQLAARVNPRLDFILSRLPPYSEDASLGYRLSPLHPEHDEQGFRNSTIPADAYLVAMGDSQTYGVNASREESYSAQLGEMQGTTNYNMAAGGYSPPQYLELLSKATEMEPEIIVAGLYSGNDLQESYWFVYLDRKARTLVSSDPALLAAIDMQERMNPSSRVAKNFEARGDRYKSPNLLRAILRVLVSTFEPVEQRWESYKQQAIIKDEFILETADQRTIFTPHKRFAALDLSDIRIREGLRISLDSLVQMKKIADQESITFLVLLIPTKELIYSEAVFGLDDYPVPRVFLDLIKAETEVWVQIKAGLDREGITYLDVLPRLRQALDEGKRIYSPNSNGHPEGEGYGVIASAIADWIEARHTEDQVKTVNRVHRPTFLPE